MRAKANCIENASDGTIRALDVIPNRACILIYTAHSLTIFALPQAHLKPFECAFRQQSEFPLENRKI
jgi:hypothetical protein